MIKILLKSKYLTGFLSIFIFLLFSSDTFAQATGDYRSQKTGVWDDLNSWQRLNTGNIWATPTAAQGYPGQFGTNPPSVSILDKHVVSLNVNTQIVNLTTLGTGQLRNDATAGDLIKISGNIVLGVGPSVTPDPKLVGPINMKIDDFSNTIEMNGIALQTISGTSDVNGGIVANGPFIYNLIISNKVGVKLATNVVVMGNLTVNAGCTYDLEVFTSNKTSSTLSSKLTLNSESVLRLSGSAGGVAGSNFPHWAGGGNSFTYVIDPTSTVEYYGANQTVAMNYATTSATVVKSIEYGNLTVSGSGTKMLGGEGVVPNSVIVNGVTSINALATFQLGPSKIIQSSSNLNLNGGILSTVGVNANYVQTFGALTLSTNSTIQLGTGIHQLNFASSNAITWKGGDLSVGGWTGVPGLSGTGGKIFVGTGMSGLTALQRTQIKLLGHSCSAFLLNTGEVVPSVINAGVIGGSKTICSGSTPAMLTSNTDGTGAGIISYEWQTNASGSFVTIPGATLATYTPPVLTSTTSYIRRTVSSCGVVKYYSTYTPQITITVTPTNTLNLTSAANSANQRICFNAAISPITYATTGATGISNNGVSGVNGLPAGVSASWASNTITISGTPTANGVFSYTIPLSGGCETQNAKGTITVGADSTYKNVGGWNNGLPNNNGLNAVIEGSYKTIVGFNINACNCDVKSGGSLTISNGTTITVENNITNTGIFTVQEGGNLIQKNNAGINIGGIVVEKLFTFITPTTPIAHRQQYNYVISPVIGQVLKNIYTGNPAALYYNEATNYFGTSTGAYIAGRGLAVKEPSEASVSTSTVTAQFKGVPFNGILEYPLAYTASTKSLYGYNLVGNPYPSNLDLQSLYDYANGNDKNAAKIEPTFQFWDNRGNLQFTQQGSGYTGDSYAKYNVISGTGVASSFKASNAPDQARIPNQYVQIGTGFMVRALSAANGQKLVFNNKMRSENEGKSYFGKQSQKDRYWLTLVTPSNLSLMNAIVYFNGGSNSFGLEDTKASGSSDDIYSIVDEINIAIQGKVPFVNTDKVNLGISAFVAGTYTISIPYKEGVFANGQSIYLKDKETLAVTNLSQGDYTFNVMQGHIDNRFEIIYQPEIVLVTDNNMKESLVVYKEGEDFIIKAQSEKITAVEVYDTSGRLVYKVQPDNTKIIIPAQYLVQGVYIFKINQKEQITVKKVVK